MAGGTGIELPKLIVGCMPQFSNDAFTRRNRSYFEFTEIFSPTCEKPVASEIMKKSASILLVLLLLISFFGATQSQAQDPFIGEIRMFGGNFAPRGWALCEGQLLPINNHSALFSILGTTYGGDGETTFALPDLRGRVPIHPGEGPGLSSKSLGEKSGSETVAVKDNIDDHPAVRTKNVRTVKKGRKKSNIVSGPVPAQSHASSAPDKSNMQPYLGVNFIIALQGTFPSED